jgi:hypothetical protein
MVANKGAVTVALIGAGGISGYPVEDLLDVPSTLTSFIPEVDLMLLPVLCVCVDNAFSTKAKEYRSWNSVRCAPDRSHARQGVKE